MKKIGLLFLLSFILVGCTSKSFDSSSVPTTTDPYANLEDIVDLDEEDEEGEDGIWWEQVEADSAYLGDPDEEYEEAKSFSMYVDEENMYIILQAIVSDKAEAEDVLEYGMTILRKFNDIAREQDYSIKKSSDNYYGGIYEEYTVELNVTAESIIDNESEYFIKIVIPAGSEYQALELN